MTIAQTVEKLFYPRAGSHASLHELYCEEEHLDLFDTIAEYGGVRMEPDNHTQLYEFEDESCISIYGNWWIATHAVCLCSGVGHNRLCPFDVEPEYDPGAYGWDGTINGFRYI